MGKGRSNVNVDVMAKAIIRELDDYHQEVAKEVDKAVQKTAKFVKNEISSNAKKEFGSGTYSGSWVTKKAQKYPKPPLNIVHSSDYQIAHLLEDGHDVLREKGKKETYIGEAKPHEHIRPARDKGEIMLEKLIKEALE